MDIDEETYYQLPVHKRHVLERREFESSQESAVIHEKIRHLHEQIQQALNEIERLNRIYRIKQAKDGDIVEKARGDKFCKECGQRQPLIFNRNKIHYLDGNHTNRAHGNIAMICPSCQSHILLSRFTSDDVWGLKMKGLSNAAIGRYLGLSRERVGQLLKKCDMESVNFKIPSIDQLIKEEQDWEKKNGRKRVTDKRTLKKRIVARLNKGAIRGRIPK
jgi:hypothetical protein